MIYDKDKRFDDDDDENELWDDDLELSSGSDDIAAPENDESSAPDNDDIASPDNDSHPEEPEDYYYGKEPEPETEERAPQKSRRGRFFGKTDENEEGDFYDSDVDPEPEPPKKPKAPKLDPEDPNYWIEEESAISSILPKPRKKWKWWLAAIGVLLIAILGVWIWFFRPYVDDAVKYGYIRDMEHRGAIMKTFEGTFIPYKEIGDPNPLQFEIVQFSVESDSLAAEMKRMMLGCVPVRVEYELYRSALPWKGESRMIIIKADSADPSKILPPEFRQK